MRISFANTKLHKVLVQRNKYIEDEYNNYLQINRPNNSRFLEWIFLIRLNIAYFILNRKYSTNEIVVEEKKEIAKDLIMVNRTLPQHLAKSILKYDIISFDIFDTLFFRAVKKPEDVFILVGEQLGIIDFVEIRKKAEKKIRDINRDKYGNHEVSLFEIYKEIKRKTGLEIEKGMQTEVEIESKLIFPNSYMKCVYDILKAQGKKIIAVSDMYLPKHVIKMLLEKCGYDIEDIFVSVEYHCNKRNLGLYKQVLGKFPGKKIVHIGDNYKTDFENSKKMGIDSIFYRNCNIIGEETLKINNISELVGSVYSGLINTTLFNGMNKFNPYFEYGYVYGGLYILGFCNWIKCQAKLDGVDKILFLARDGYIYEKVFRMLDKEIETEYVYWSRVASIIGNLQNNKYELIKRLVDHKADSVNPTRIVDVLNIIGITSEDIQLNNFQLSEDQILCESNKAYLEEALLENYEVISNLIADSNNELRKMLEYHIGDSKRIAVVDVGWTGTCVLTIKDIIENQSKLDCRVECYLAASKVKGNVANLIDCMDGTIKTYMFSQINNRYLYDYHVSANKGSNSIYFELFTQACMPSFRGVTKEGILKFDVAEVENYEIISEIHKGILYFVRQYITFAHEFPILYNISGSDAYQPYKFISENIGYIRKIFKNFTYARGVGGDIEIETVEDIMNSLKL